MRHRRYVLALTGASGAAYGRRLLERLAASGADVHLIVSGPAAKVLEHELHLRIDLADGAEAVRLLLGREAPNVLWHQPDEVEAPISSGSFPHDGMAVVPCSMGTLGRIAHGISSNLIERAADVCLKERRRLVLVPRETPYSLVHLRNMTAATEAGAVVLPASPGLYGPADTVDDLIDFVAGRVLDHLGVPHDLGPRYGEPARRRHPEEE